MQPIAEPQPLCHRCKKPMTLHAVEAVEEKNGAAATMEIFRCDTCAQLSAREQAVEVAA